MATTKGTVTSVIEWTWLAGIGLEECLPELLEGPEHNSLSNPPHGVKVKVQVVQRVKGSRVHLAGDEKIAQIGPGVPPAGRAPAVRVDRPVVLGVPGVLDGDGPLSGEELAVPGVAGGQDAVEQVDAPGDTLHQVVGHAGAHQVARPVG